MGLTPCLVQFFGDFHAQIAQTRWLSKFDRGSAQFRHMAFWMHTRLSITFDREGHPQKH